MVRKWRCEHVHRTYLYVQFITFIHTFAYTQKNILSRPREALWVSVTLISRLFWILICIAECCDLNCKWQMQEQNLSSKCVRYISAAAWASCSCPVVLSSSCLHLLCLPPLLAFCRLSFAWQLSSPVLISTAPALGICGTAKVTLRSLSPKIYGVVKLN